MAELMKQLSIADVTEAVSAVSAVHGAPSMDWLQALYDELIRRTQGTT